MKKEYIKPTMAVIHIESEQIICASGPENSIMNLGVTGEEPGTSTTGDFTGIFGE